MSLFLPCLSLKSESRMDRGRQKEHCNDAKSKWGGPQPKREGPQPRFMSHQKTKVRYHMKKGKK